MQSPWISSTGRAMTRPMRAYVCEVDQHGLRQFLPEDLLPDEELRRLAWITATRPTKLVWALLDEDDAEDLRARLRAGRYCAACGLLLNRAVELRSLAHAAPGRR